MARECAVLQAKTGHVAVENRAFQNVKRHILRIKAEQADFSCIFARVWREGRYSSFLEAVLIL